jgi:ankyrin repeat protein/cell wall assembly regulator SMI1
MSTDLQKAIQGRKDESLEKLLEGGAPVNEAFADGKFPLACAVLSENPRAVRALLRAGADVDARNPPNQDTALRLAAYKGYADIARMLLNAGADPNLENSQGFTPLREAVRDRTAVHLELTRALIEAGANVNAGKFFSILMTACRNASSEIVETLISAGAVINAVLPRGTALTTAVEENRPDIVAVLLAHGADWTIRTPAQTKHPGLTPLELARKLEHRHIIVLLEQISGVASPESIEPARPVSVDAAWEEIIIFLRKWRPQVARSLREGTSQDNLAKMEQVLGLLLPDGFKEFYQQQDGQKEGADPLVPPGFCGADGYRFLALREVLAEWRRWRKLTKMGEFRGMKSGPDKGVRDDWWNLGWVPFADNGHGDLVCLDMAPAPGGRPGQIITMNHASTKRVRLAPSLTQWLVDLAGFLRNEKRNEKGNEKGSSGKEEKGTA